MAAQVSSASKDVARRVSKFGRSGLLLKKRRRVMFWVNNNRDGSDGGNGKVEGIVGGGVVFCEEDDGGERREGKDNERDMGKEKKGWLWGWRMGRGKGGSVEKKGGSGGGKVGKEEERGAGNGVLRSSSAWRKWFFRISRERILITMEGRVFQMMPVAMDGDCGFSSMARSLNFRKRDGDVGAGGNAGLGGKEVKVKDLRQGLMDEVIANREFYEERLKWDEGDVDDKMEKFLKSVTKAGLLGHWLGSQLGMLEFVALARATGIWLEVFTFDVKRQKVRRFEEFKGGDIKVAMFFSGPALSGHFDCLIEREKAPPLIEPRSCAIAAAEQGGITASPSGASTMRQQNSTETAVQA